MTSVIAADFLRRALRNFLAEVQNGYAVGHAHDQTHIVLNQDDG